jgi:segregation and condensation protein A
MLTTVGRFLALLELFRENVVAFDQLTPLGDLNVRWTGVDDSEIEIDDEYDEHAPPSPSDAEGTDDPDGGASETGDGDTAQTTDQMTDEETR